MAFDLQTFKADLHDCSAYLRRWHPEARTDFQFYALKQWDEKDAAALAEENRPALTFDRTRTIIDSVSGSEITNRFEPKYLPRNASLASPDSRLSEMMSEVYRWTRQQSRAEHWQSLAFKDAATCGIGCLEKFLSYKDNPYGRITTKRVDPFEIAWDPSAHDTNLDDARYLIRGRWMALKEFREMFPDKADEFDAYRAQRGTPGQVFGALAAPVHDQASAWMYKNGEFYDERTKRVLVFEYQWVETAPELCLYLPDNEYRWLSEEELEQLQEQRAAQAMAAAAAMPPDSLMGLSPGASPAGVLPPLDVVKIPRSRYYRAFVAGDMLLDEGPCPIEDFTYDFITGFRDDSEEGRTYWFGLMRPMRDPQRYANKIFSQAAHIFASNPKGALVYESGTFANPGKAAQEWAKPNGLVEVNPGRMATFERLEPARMPPGLEFLFQVAVQGVSTSVGVSESYFVGTADDLKRTASSAVTSVQQRTLTTLSALFDSLRLYIKQDGAKTLKWIREYMPEGQLVRIIGEDGEPTLVPFTKQWASQEYDIIVEDAPASKSAQEEFNRALLQNGVLQAMFESGTPPPPSIADTMPISTVAKTEWKQSLLLNKQVAEANAQLALAQAQMQQMQVQMAQQQMLMAQAQGMPLGGQQQGAPQGPPQ